MTLVVGRLVDGFVRIVADSQISSAISVSPMLDLDAATLDCFETRFRTPFEGALKILAVSPDAAIAYSSRNIDHALNAIRVAFESLGRPLSVVSAGELAKQLVSSTANGDHEFIVASRSKFHILKAGRVEADQDVAWIGDQKGFEEYQRLYHRSPTSAQLSEGDAICVRMSDAISGVISEGKLPSIGGVPITLTANGCEGDGFRYLGHVRGYDFHRVSGFSTPQSVLHSRSAADGGYNYSLLVPSRPGVPAVGVHISQPRMGALFLPLRCNKPIVINDVSASQFIDKIVDLYGVELGGMHWGETAISIPLLGRLVR